MFSTALAFGSLENLILLSTLSSKYTFCLVFVPVAEQGIDDVVGVVLGVKLAEGKLNESSRRADF